MNDKKHQIICAIAGQEIEKLKLLQMIRKVERNDCLTQEVKEFAHFLENLYNGLRQVNNSDLEELKSKQKKWDEEF